MPQQGIIYRILVASPSDCVKERKLVPELIYAWNAVHSFTTGAILEPVLWETHARPELGARPQAIINKQLVDTCDILIGTFWTRLGTSTGKAESGTAEEIEEFRTKDKPVLLYFSSAPVVPESLDADQYFSLTEYKKNLGQDGLYFHYESLEQLRDLLQRHLAGEMNRLHSSATNSSTPSQDMRQADQLREYIAQFESFLRRLEAEWVSERDSDPNGIDEGKLITTNALENVLSFRSQIVDGLNEVTRILDEASNALRAMQRHQLFLDGGKSFQQFWANGDAIIRDLKTVPAAISAEPKDQA